MKNFYIDPYQLSNINTGSVPIFPPYFPISEKIGQLVDEIASASAEQAEGIKQVSATAMEMEKVTQSTAASAEESAAASEELNAQAEQMKAFVNELIGVIEGRTDKTA